MIKKIMESVYDEQEYYNRNFPKYKKHIKQIRDVLDSIEADYDDVESYLLSNKLNNSLLSDVDNAMSNLLDAWVRIGRCELSFDRLMNAVKKQSNKSFESKNTKRSGRKLKESNDFADEDIVMYYKGKKIFEGGSDELGVKAALSDLMYGDDKFYQDAKDFLENELGIEVTDIDDCAYTLADQIDTEATYADSIESFYIPFGKFEAFFKSEEALT